MPEGPPSAARRLGDYELVQWIATGGMAEVYVARRYGARGFSKLVALKRILPQFAADAEFSGMFIDEARLCAGLSHPNLVEVFDFGEQDGELFMAMELVDGTTCARLVRAAAARGEAVPPEDALFLTLNVLRGLEYAHDAVDVEGRSLQLVHRDVSPGNVLISQSGAIKLGDFGIVRAATFEHRTEHGQLKGKLGYMSPEQVSGLPLDRRSDLFTLGIVLAEMLVGRPLFSFGAELDILVRIRDADTAVFTRHAGKLPEDLCAVVYQALARDPADRFQSAGAFAEAIETVVRRRRLILGPTRLVAYLETLGLIKTTSRSGEFRARGVVDSTPRASPQHARPLAPEQAAEPSPRRYTIRLPDGAVLGPMSLAQAIEAFLTGRAAVESEVSCDGDEFAPARSFSELRRITSVSAHRWDVNLDAPGSVRHAIEARTLPSVLFSLAEHKDACLALALQGPQRRKIFVNNGLVELATSTSADELLGERLLREGMLLPVELDMALALAPRFGGRFGDALIGLGILRPIEVFRAIYAQVRSRATELLRWRSGELWELAGVRCHDEGLPQGLSLLELVALGVIEAYTEDELHELLRPIMNEPIWSGPRSRPSPVAMRLPPGPTRAWLTADGNPLGVLLERLPRSAVLSRRDVLVGVFLGLSCGALEPCDLFRTAASAPGR